jgi:hypothetical protein
MSSTKKTEYALSALYETAVTGKGKPGKHKIKDFWPNIDQALKKNMKGISLEDVST